MLPPLGAAGPGEHFYARSTKCCTFLPQLPNFSIGAILEQQPQRIEVGPAQLRTPMGLLARAQHEDRYRTMVAEGGFGRDTSMRCPYYEQASGGCGIWAFRDAQCSTWFCRHEHGQRSSDLWAAVRGMLAGVEGALTLWCVREHGLAVVDAAHDDQGAWGRWWGREAEFYRDCSAAVDGLDAAGLRRLLPESAVGMREAVVRARTALREPAPLVTLRR